MNEAHRVVDFRQHPARTVWLHRTEFEETIPQPIDAIREDFMEPADRFCCDSLCNQGRDCPSGHPLTREEAQYIGAVVCFGIGVLIVAFCAAAYALWPMLRALW